MGYTPLLIRGTVLFFLGVFFCLVFNLLQVQRESTIFSPEVLARLFSSAWWVAPCCGIAAAVIGLLYPCLDERLGEPHTGEWSNVMRCIAVFVGINHASAKIDFENNLQFSLTLTAMSIGLWWLFDRSGSGFGLGVAIAIVATFITQLLIYHGVQRLSGVVSAVIFLISIDTAWNMGLYNQDIQYTKLDYLFVRSWLPCTFFSGGVTMGNIGRQLAMYDHRKVKDE